MPLTPVSPLPELPELSPRRLGPSALARLLAVLVAVLSGLNGLLLWGQRTQNRRLAQLENTVAMLIPGRMAPIEEEVHNAGHVPRTASLENRLAALLAVAGDANRCRRLLDTLSSEECERIGQGLIARPAAGDRNAALACVVNFLAGSEPQRAAGLLNSVPEPVLRTTLARELMETWTASHPDDAARWLVADGAKFLNTTAASGPVVRAVTQWSSFDPVGAAKFAVGLTPDRGPVSRALFLASRAWGQFDPAAAFAWVNTLSANDQRHGQALQGAWEGWTEKEPARAGAALRQQFYAGANRPLVEFAGIVGKQWAQADPAGAAQWAQTLPGNGARRVALQQIALAWTQEDAAGAARWAATLPGSEIRAPIWSGIVERWTDDDPEATGTWLGGLPLGRDHDEAVAAYISKVTPAEPEKALAWAATVSDPEIRADEVQRVLGQWERHDAGAARNWAAANAVPILPPRAAGQ